MRNLITFLEDRLQKGLPGREAQIRMAPKPISGGSIREMEAPDTANNSSVLLLIFPNEEDKLELILTVRSQDIDHGGQISFPGGRQEQDETPVETALREANEEIGISPSSIQIIGQLSDLYVQHSNNLVHPIVGFLKRRPKFVVNHNEVSEVFAVELDSLLHKKNLTVEDWELHTHKYEVPFWDVHQVPLWGATAMMLNEFLELYREFKNTLSQID